MRLWKVLIASVALAVLLSGCGGDGGSGGGDATTVNIDVAPGTLKFEEEQATVEAGTVTLRSENPDSVEHNIAIEGNGVNESGELVKDGGVSEVTVDLKPGTYEFYCTPHRAAGMVGTLTVT